METVKTIGKEYRIYSVTGKVLDAKKHYETRVSGGGGGGYSHQGSGYTAPVSISSTTVIHDIIFLLDKDGKEHAIELTNFDITSRESNEMTAVWAIKKNKKSGPYVAIINHTLSKISFNGTKIFLMMVPHWLLLVGSVILLGLIFNATLIFLTIVAWLVFGYIKARDFKKEIEMNYNLPAS
jgi:hypothetical protein